MHQSLSFEISGKKKERQKYLDLIAKDMSPVLGNGKKNPNFDIAKYIVDTSDYEWNEETREYKEYGQNMTYDLGSISLCSNYIGSDFLSDSLTTGDVITYLFDLGKDLNIKISCDESCLSDGYEFYRLRTIKGDACVDSEDYFDYFNNIDFSNGNESLKDFLENDFWFGYLNRIGNYKWFSEKFDEDSVMEWLGDNLSLCECSEHILTEAIHNRLKPLEIV